MIDKNLTDMVDKLHRSVTDQKKKANKALNDLPDGETKLKLRALIKKASTGKLSMEDAQKALSKIQEDAC